jgi:hypothetical protein
LQKLRKDRRWIKSNYVKELVSSSHEEVENRRENGIVFVGR